MVSLSETQLGPGLVMLGLLLSKVSMVGKHVGVNVDCSCSCEDDK